jgi:hypothetical protein
MADVSKIKTPDNTTYNLKDAEGRKEENLVWGGTNKVGEVSPIGMSLSNEHSANRLAYINGDSLYFEYSSNSGSTWTSYDYTSGVKSQFCTLSYQVPIGRSSSSTNYSTSSRTRITLTAQNGTTGYVYTNPRKMLINISSSGGMQVLVEYRTGVNYQSSGAWSTFGTYNLSGWSGWNDIPLILSTLGGGTSQTGNCWQLRLTFIMTSFNSSYPTTAFVNSIRIYGENGWGTTSNMGATGHLYSYDNSQNATFPANVQIKNGKQVGWLSATPTSGQVIVADGTGGGIKTSGYTIAKSVPSDAKFTDNNTTYTFANGTNGFTVTPSGGSAQTVTVTPSIANNVTGSGTSGYLTKFNGAHTITNGPALGSDTTKFLRNDGTWATPSGSGNKIFTVQPTTPYIVGDLYISEDNNILVCNTARSSGSYNSDDWGSAVNAMSTQEVSDAIDGDILVVTGNSANGGNVILRLNNGIPYEVLITDTPTNITSSSAKIYRWDSSGLRYSSTGYNGTYTTILNSSGKIPTGVLTGPLNANSFSAIQNFTAAMIHGGTLTRGASNNSEGTIELKNASGTVIAQVGNYGFKFYGPGAGDSRPYYVIDNSSNGIAGYTATGTLAFKIATDEFRMPKAYVATELNIGNMIKIVPTSNATHSGISFVAAT